MSDLYTVKKVKIKVVGIGAKHSAMIPSTLLITLPTSGVLIYSSLPCTMKYVHPTLTPKTKTTQRTSYTGGLEIISVIVLDTFKFTIQSQPSESKTTNLQQSAEATCEGPVNYTVTVDLLELTMH